MGTKLDPGNWGGFVEGRIRQIFPTKLWQKDLILFMDNANIMILNQDIILSLPYLYLNLFVLSELRE